MAEYSKTFVYDVDVYNREGEIIKQIPSMSSKEIEKLKTTFKNKEYVKYRLTGWR